MRPGFGQFNVATPEYLALRRAVRRNDVLLNTPLLPGAQRWELSDLVKLRLSVEQYGLKLTALENVPTSFYDHIMLNGPRRDEQIENMIYTVRNMARAGIPIFGYNWMPSHVWRTPPQAIRGGALATAFDDALAQKMPLTHDRVYSEEEMWANLEYWIDIITPVAEQGASAWVSTRAIRRCRCWAASRRFLRNFAAYKRLIEIYPSDCNAIEFCQGTMAEMQDDVDIYDKIRYFGSRNKILYVHFRNVSGTVPALRRSSLIPATSTCTKPWRSTTTWVLTASSSTTTYRDISRHRLGPSRPSLRQRLHPGADRSRYQTTASGWSGTGCTTRGYGHHVSRVGGAAPHAPFAAPLVPRCALSSGATPRVRAEPPSCEVYRLSRSHLARRCRTVEGLSPVMFLARLRAADLARQPVAERAGVAARIQSASRWTPSGMSSRSIQPNANRK